VNERHDEGRREGRRDDGHRRRGGS
jgi:hypothetical protein